MDNFPKDFDIQKARLLAQTDAAKELFSMLQAKNDPKIQNAMHKAAAGDMTQAKALLAQMMENEQMRQLLQQLMGGNNG